MNKKNNNYKLYIEEHKNNVSNAWDTLQKFLNLDDDVFNKVQMLIEIHDASKYSEEEFQNYRQFFYPETGEVVSKKDFDIGWNHHQKRNPHHWQYWVMYKSDGSSKALEMPYEYILEMVCDWIAMSVKFKNLPSEWFNDNIKKMLLHKKTLFVLEQLIPYADETYRSIVL